ncbi:MAG: polysaccharide biosynthesis/export family protein [Smithella sp.]
MKHKKIATWLLAAVISAGIPMEALAAEQQTPIFTTQTNSQPLEEYHLSKYDVINIVIIGFPDAAGFSDIMIGPDGYVNLPYAGTLHLAGMTIPEATEVLTEKLGEYIKIPGMAVMVKQYGPRKIYVMGEVVKQGLYSLSSDYMNIFAALSSAGGVTKRGRPKHIAVVRTIDGKVYMQEVNLDRFVEKQDGSQNVILQDGDIVYVPKSNKIDLYEDIMPLVGVYATYKSITN